MKQPPPPIVSIAYSSTENDVLGKFADEISKRISRKVIHALRKRPVANPDAEPELENVWIEFCIMCNVGQTHQWAAYDEYACEVVFSVIEEHVGKLKDHEILAVWYQTDAGYGWRCTDMDDDETPSEDRWSYYPASTGDVVSYIYNEYLCKMAGDYSNKRIRAYRDRYY